MLDEVNETIDMVWQSESSASPDPPDYILAYNAILYGISISLYLTPTREGCQAYVMAHCGMQQAAAESAAKAVNFASRLGMRILFWALPLAISYALQVISMHVRY